MRTLVNASDPANIRKANALQDQLEIEAVSAKSYTTRTTTTKAIRSPIGLLLRKKSTLMKIFGSQIESLKKVSSGFDIDILFFPSYQR